MLMFETVPEEGAQLVPTMPSDTNAPPIADLDLVQEIEHRLARNDCADGTMSKRRSSPFIFNLDSLTSPRSSLQLQPGRRMSDAVAQLLRSGPPDQISEMDAIAAALQIPPVKSEATPMDFERTTVGIADATTQRPQTRTSEANAIACLAEITATTNPTTAIPPVIPHSSSSSGCRTSARARRDLGQRPKSPEPHSSGKAKARKGNAGKAKPAAPQLDTTPLPLQPGGPLPMDHRPARGRGRAQQLKSMTKAQIEAEALAMQEKNRLAARELRLKRKKHEAQLENRVAELERKDAESKKLIAKLQAKLRWYERDN